MSFSKSLCSALLFAVILAPACNRAASQAKAMDCDGAVFQGQCAVKGSTVKFGNYPQATENPEPIEWIVLDIVPNSGNANGKILLLSKHVLDYQIYDDKPMKYNLITDALSGGTISATWEDCTLRSWLNKKFMKSAFSSNDQTSILTTHLDNPDNPKMGTSGGKDTDDKVFLLSIADMDKYFGSNATPEAKPTQYAKNNDKEYEYRCADPYCSKKCTEVDCSMGWWLRSPGVRGYAADIAFLLYEDGDRWDVHYTGTDASDHRGVRPAVWVQY